MSKFFRSSADSDSESSSSDGSSSNGSPNAMSDSALREESNVSLGLSLEESNSDSSAVAIPATASSSITPKDMLLHALLEERCLTEARNELGRAGREGDQSSIQALARRKYKHLVAQLAPYGLVSAGLEADSHETTRQQYRDGLDLLWQSSTSTALQTRNTQVAVSAPIRRLLTGPASDSPGSDGLLIGLQRLQVMQALSSSISPSIPSAFPAQASLHGNRYNQEFDELGVLGKGGYGIVYHVKHKLDGLPYAVKKVPLSSSRLQKIHLRGQREVDELLTELRTLARLDHPNIVRYFSGWIEWATFNNPTSSFGSETQPHLLPHEATTTASDSQPSLFIGRVDTESISDDAHVLFEDSVPRSDPSTSSLASSNEVPLTRTQTRSSTATASEGIETINREGEFEPSESAFMPSSTNGSPFPVSEEPTLALHMQMALYPMTLAEFLTSSQPQYRSSVDPLIHCFHVDPSVRIMLAILDGVDYLHSEGIIHRDLKPGNIFLGPNTNPRNTRGSVDLMLCEECREHGNANPVSLNVRIGDFGLVTAIANPEAGEEAISYDAVGTEIYRPQKGVTMSTSLETLDVFALGIVLFELCWKFDTRMERLDTLRGLKQGRFPPGFFTSTKMDVIASCINDMMMTNTVDHTNLKDIKRKLSSLI